ncbi:hypothetical protein QR680_005454 [Steinernema hermaphroditum]|uniref:SCP domain-containing protein n=1 Tax=Steinernema hermaphroditum TaxID=289476 RepID=A0AA39HUC1_9BILA|nr:hypothetical protein QR680_005454 [Steinernema hermaphroditum]
MARRTITQRLNHFRSQLSQRLRSGTSIILADRVNLFVAPPVWSIAEEALENWWSEVERLEAEKGAKELRYTEAMRPVGHFTQPARGDLREIGCGYAIYGKQHFFFCNFDKGNTPNSTVLNFGSSCVRDSDCAWYTGFSCIRDTGLCTVNSPRNGSAISRLLGSRALILVLAFLLL